MEGIKGSFFKNKILLVTGASGFIGSHLCRRLLEEGAKVHILLKKDSNIFKIQDILGSLHVWYGDITDYPSVYACIRGSKPEIIFHLAAFRDTRRDFNLVNQMIDVNIKGTLNLLKIIFEKKIRLEKFINTGTSEEYGDGPAPFQENQKEKPVSPYSASKVAVTYFSQMIHRSFGLPIVTLRPFLVYGPYQDTDMFIPSLIQHCLEGKDFQMTEGDQTREFNYIDDVIDAFLLAACCPAAKGEIINIGNGIEYTIRYVAEKIVQKMGNPIKLLVGALPKRVGETKHFFSNNHKARYLLGWSPKVTLEEGIDRTIDWYKNFWKVKMEKPFTLSSI